jgi:hypothetical protein
MGILASALPGFRDLRAPLVAGYLWLLFVWLLVDPELPPPADHGTGVVDTMIDLADTVGTVWVALGVSVAAYLIGSISQTLSAVVGWLLRKVGVLLQAAAIRLASGGAGWFRQLAAIRSAPATARLASMADDRVSPLIDEIKQLESNLVSREAEVATLREEFNSIADFAQTEEFKKAVEQAPSYVSSPEEYVLRSRYERLAAKYGLASRHELEPHLASREAKVSALRAEFNRVADSADTEGVRLRRALERELSLPATLLIGEQPETFAEADRIRGESDLRLAVVPPFVALTFLLGAENPFWYATFAGILALAIQGLVKQDDARGVVAGAIIFGKARSAALERWDRAAADVRRRSRDLDEQVAEQSDTAIRQKAEERRRKEQEEAHRREEEYRIRERTEELDRREQKLVQREEELARREEVPDRVEYGRPHVEPDQEGQPGNGSTA